MIFWLQRRSLYCSSLAEICVFLVSHFSWHLEKYFSMNAHITKFSRSTSYFFHRHRGKIVRYISTKKFPNMVSFTNGNFLSFRHAFFQIWHFETWKSSSSLSILPRNYTEVSDGLWDVSNIDIVTLAAFHLAKLEYCYLAHHRWKFTSFFPFELTFSNPCSLINFIWSKSGLKQSEKWVTSRKSAKNNICDWKRCAKFPSAYI